MTCSEIALARTKHVVPENCVSLRGQNKREVHTLPEIILNHILRVFCKFPKISKSAEDCKIPDFGGRAHGRKQKRGNVALAVITIDHFRYIKIQLDSEA